ncbi:class I SAM-dependent methyltransferase [Vibrio breoganii]
MKDRYHDNSRKEMIAFITTEPKRVLEIGSGTGKFRNHFNEDIEYWGIEPDITSADIACKVNKMKVIVGSVPSVDKLIPNDYFDLIVCNDVIEHIQDTKEVFNFIESKLTKNGKIIASIPNVRYLPNLKELLLFKDWRYRQAGILDRTHLRFFTKKSSLRMLNENNFHIIKYHGINSIYEGGNIWRRILNRIKYFIPILILGQDTQYLQFGFAIEKRSNNLI